MKRVLVIGGYGNFGGYICRSLCGDPNIELLVGGRSIEKAKAFAAALDAANSVEGCALDIDGDLAVAFARLRPDIVIDESYLLIADGQGFTKSEGYFRLLQDLGGSWRLLAIGRVVPQVVRDWVYDLVARNRYRWFGKTTYCTLLTPEQRKRLLDS